MDHEHRDPLAVDVAALRRTGADVLTGSPGWQRAQATFGDRSEYGPSAFGAFVQVGLYLN